MSETVTAQHVLEFWFQGEPDTWRTDPWFKKSDAFDTAIRTRFGTAVQAAQDGVLDGWAETPEGTLALLLLLDQFGRNIHRGSPLAFAGDARARRIARAAIAAGAEAALTPVQRVFLYLPFEHSESLDDQADSIRLFESLPPAGEWRDSVVEYAHKHLEVLRRFGRYPHRNAALGRASTPEEEAWLREGGGF